MEFSSFPTSQSLPSRSWQGNPGDKGMKLGVAETVGMIYLAL
jgi:hypothetical protein